MRMSKAVVRAVAANSPFVPLGGRRPARQRRVAVGRAKVKTHTFVTPAESTVFASPIDSRRSSTQRRKLTASPK